MRSPSMGPALPPMAMHAAAHAERLADENAAGPLAHIARDRDGTAHHARTGKHAGTAFDLDRAALHAGAEIGAGIAVDDDLAFAERGADLVAARVGADKLERARVLAFHLEGIADSEPLARRADGESFDLLRLQVFQPRRDQRREIEPLIGLALELEAERAHAMISLRWK